MNNKPTEQDMCTNDNQMKKKIPTCNIDFCISKVFAKPKERAFKTAQLKIFENIHEAYYLLENQNRTSNSHLTSSISWTHVICNLNVCNYLIFCKYNIHFSRINRTHILDLFF